MPRQASPRRNGGRTGPGPSQKLQRRPSSLWLEMEKDLSDSEAEILVDDQGLYPRLQQLKVGVQGDTFTSLDRKLRHGGQRSIERTSAGFQCLEGAIEDVFIKVANACSDINQTWEGWTWRATCRDTNFERSTRGRPSLLSLSTWVDISADASTGRQPLAWSYKAVAARPPTQDAEWKSRLWRTSSSTEADTSSAFQ